jgi:Glycerophosphoryl diester phosphodiesterase
MLLIAHRCGSDLYPELTLESARHSLKIGADYVEMDIRLTLDSVPIICHDKDGRRLFGDERRMEKVTLEQFTALRRVEGAPYFAMTLEDVLSSDVGPILFHMKVKGEALVTVLERLSKCEDGARFLLGVSTAEDVKSAKRLCPHMRTLAFMPEKEQMADFIAAGVDVVRLWSDWVAEKDIKAIHNAGCEVFIMSGKAHDGTVGIATDEEAAMWKSMGADGILVNNIAQFTAFK